MLKICIIPFCLQAVDLYSLFFFGGGGEEEEENRKKHCLHVVVTQFYLEGSVRKGRQSTSPPTSLPFLIPSPLKCQKLCCQISQNQTEKCTRDYTVGQHITQTQPWLCTIC